MWAVSARVLIIICFSLSLLFGFPHLIGQIFNQPYVSTVVVDVTPYSFDEHHYAERIQKIFATGTISGDSFTYEHRNSPQIFPYLSTMFLGYLSKLVGSVQNMFIFADFIFPPLIFLSIYYLGRKLEMNKTWSIVASIVILLEDQFLGLLLAIQRMIVSRSTATILEYHQNIFSPPFYSRLENPQFTGIFFFLALAALALFIHKKTTLMSQILFIGCYGVLVYSYPFFSIYLGILFASLFLHQLIFSRDRIGFWIRTGVGCFFVSLPYVWQFFSFYRLPIAPELSQRWGMQSSAGYIPPIAFITMLIVIFFFLIYRKKNEKVIFSFLMIVCALVSMVVFKVQTDHFVSRILVPVLRLSWVVLISTFFAVYIRKKTTLTQAVISYLVLFVFFASFAHVWWYTKNTVSDFTLEKDRLAAYIWVRNNIPQNSVVLSMSVENNYELHAHTPVYTFLPYAMFSFASNEEIFERLLIAFKLTHASDRMISNILSVPELPNGRWMPTRALLEKNGGFIYLTNYAKKERGYGLSEDELNSFLTRYRQMPNMSIDAIRKKYKLDYLFWGPYEALSFTLPENAEKIYQNSRFSVYKL